MGFELSENAILHIPCALVTSIRLIKIVLVERFAHRCLQSAFDGIARQIERGIGKIQGQQRVGFVKALSG